MKSVQSLQLKNQKVLIRVDFNVPIKNGVIQDDFRIQSALPTIQYCTDQGASVTLMSHLGRPNGKRVEELSLIPIGEYLSDLLQKVVKFSNACISKQAINVSQNLLPGEVHLLENLRFFPGETENETKFSQKLAQHGTVYVNDAFGTAHRAHASNVGVVKYFHSKGVGFLMDREYNYLYRLIQNPKRPLVIVLGGAKIKTKLSLIHRFLREADEIMIGGGMAFTFLKAKGFEIGNSLLDENLIDIAQNILLKAKEFHVQLHLPEDFIVSKNWGISSEIKEKNINNFESDDIGYDIGTETLKLFRKIVNKANTLIWNGPMGVFENFQYQRGTKGLAKAVAKIKEKGGLSIIGGGDTTAAVRLMKLETFMSHISTGGGASLELLAGKKLPAFLALEDD